MPVLKAGKLLTMNGMLPKSIQTRSQAVVVKESLRPLPSISTDVVVAMEAKIEALTAELEKKNREQETIKEKMGAWSKYLGILCLI
ncbi:hypothetical protein MTR_4g012560 [Medicago truncatula]|uniref:Uncharacterized protein n=1 Tax=Medicago truncatula TaxID=3880 RepID=G7JJB5_MEDTR|nr:hypothetical protein MTR_4g012560 [Medicago truncatula]